MKQEYRITYKLCDNHSAVKSVYGSALRKYINQNDKKCDVKFFAKKVEQFGPTV